MNKKKIAVIGSGISGLSAAFFLSKKFQVHLFEKNKNLGGHTRTINFFDCGKNLSIDTGFIVFNEKNYPDLISFFNYLGVSIENSEMSFSVSCKSPNLEYAGKNLNTFFAQRKNLFSPNFLLLLFEIIKFYKICRNIKLSDNQYVTLDEFLNYNNYSESLRNLHIYPMISSIWSCSKKDVKAIPLTFFINFFKNHMLFDFVNRPKWKFVKGGSYNYIKVLEEKKYFNISTNSKVKKIIRGKGKIKLVLFNKILEFDKVILASNANDALNLLEQPTNKEFNLLSSFKYTKNKAFLHCDENLMPKTKLAWSSWNFIQNDLINDQFSVTYWMNKLQKIKESRNYFVSINPNFVPKNIIDSTSFEHPIFNFETLNSQKKLSSIQGIKNTFYCGSYCGYGFHEDGIQSAAYIANILNIPIPWIRKKNFKSRLNY